MTNEQNHTNVALGDFNSNEVELVKSNFFKRLENLKDVNNRYFKDVDMSELNLSETQNGEFISIHLNNLSSQVLNDFKVFFENDFLKEEIM